MAWSLALTLFVCCLAVPAASVDSRDLVRNRTNHFIACPVLAGLYQRGLLKPDKYGRVTAWELQKGLEATGVSWNFAMFQAKGIAGYRADDLHQNVRHTPASIDAAVSTLYVNLFTMNVGDGCAVVGARSPGGYHCNANTQFQQHGYSTTMRDTRFDNEDPHREKRFDFFVGSELVDPSSVSAAMGEATSERVLTFDGFARVLHKARWGKGGSQMLSADFNSEYSLTPENNHTGSNIEKYHPSVTAKKDYYALAAWQPLLAWAGWWAAFSRSVGETSYFTESDLKGFFIRGEFPEDWEPSEWGFHESMKVQVALDKKGLGANWIHEVKKMLLPDGALFAESRYATELAIQLFARGMLWDSIHNTWPSSEEAPSSEAAHNQAIIV